jgi:hypothetical protein
VKAEPRLDEVAASEDGAGGGVPARPGRPRADRRAAGGCRDEAIISAIAIAGRAMVLLLLAHLSMMSPSGTGPSGWTTAWYDLVIAAIAVTCAGQTWTMASHGPVARLVIPPFRSTQLAAA